MARSKFVCMACVVLAFAVCGILAQRSRSQPPPEQVTEVHPPADQTYVGSKACAACHFKQMMVWKKTKHATEAFQKLPAKYRGRRFLPDLPLDGLWQGNRVRTLRGPRTWPAQPARLATVRAAPTLRPPSRSSAKSSRRSKIRKFGAQSIRSYPAMSVPAVIPK